MHVSNDQFSDKFNKATLFNISVLDQKKSES